MSNPQPTRIAIYPGSFDPLTNGHVDIIVLDPPYEYAALATAVREAASQRRAGGLLVLEHAWRVTPPAPPGLTVTRTVKSGDSALSFYA